MNKKPSSKKPTIPVKKTASRAKKGQASQGQPFFFATWMKYVAMLLGIAGVCLILLGSYGTFRAFIHQIHSEDSFEQSKNRAPRAPDGSRMPVEKEESKVVREALEQAEQSSKKPSPKPNPKAPTTQPPVQSSKAPSVPHASLSKAQIFDPAHPKMVIVIDDIGESLADVRALLSLDFPVTFAIWPHATYAKKAAMLIYSEGKEIILHQPMQAIDAKTDPGKGALYVGMSTQEIRQILQANLALVPHVIGLNNHMGSRFTQDAGIRTVCDVLKERRLFALDSVTHVNTIFYNEAQKKGLPSARRNVFLDAVAGEKNVLFELDRAEGIAKEKGLAIAIGHPFATTISGLQAWSKIRDKSIAIVRLQDIVH